MTAHDPTKYKHKPSEKHTLEEVLKSLQDLIRNDLLEKGKAAPSDQEPHTEHAAPAREILASAASKTEPVDLDGVLHSLKELITRELDGATTQKTETMPPAGPPEAETDFPDEFEPPDESRALDEETALAESPPATPAMPQLPGEISAELPAEPETSPAPPASKTESVRNLAPGAQRELSFDEAPPREETLPTIEVEETEDESAHFDALAVEAKKAALPAEDISAVIGAPAGTESETPPVPPAGDGQAAAQEPVAVPASESEPATEITRETPAVENAPSMPSADFDTLDLEPTRATQAESPVSAETPAPESEAPSTAAESGPPAVPVSTEESMVAEEPPAAEIKTEATPEPEQTQTPGGTISPGAEAEAHETASPATAEPAPPEAPPFNLDDIPVLKEVVAPPVGGRLAVEPGAATSSPPRSSPDRIRDIVVRAVAKLNVEMRKSGGGGLDPKTILRLQQLMREELEKDGEK